MANIKISSLSTGVPRGTDETPAVDTLDTTQSASGTTKKYIRSDELNFYLHAQGQTTYDAVVVATASALTATYSNGTSGVGATLTNAGAQAAISINGVSLSLSDRVLVKDQGSTFQNGIYVVSTVGTSSSNWVLTRATDYDESSEIVQYGLIFANQGTVLPAVLWEETAAGPFTIGTSPITFSQYVTPSLSSPVLLSQGGTSASLTADDGGIFYSTASAGAILASTATAGKVLQSGSSSAPSWSVPTYPSSSGTAGTILRSNGTNNVYTTSTFADTYAINRLLYASSANTVVGLATANSGVLVTSAGGVPSISSTLPASLTATGPFNVDNLRLQTNTLSSTDTNGYISLIPNGTGQVRLGTITGVTGLGAGFFDVTIAKNSSRTFLNICKNSSSASSGSLAFYTSRNTTVGSFTTINNGDQVAALQANADDGTSFVTCGQIQFTVTSAPSTGIVPTDFRVYTQNTSGVTTLGLTVTNAQNTVLAGSLTTSQTAGIIGTTTNNNANAGSVGELISSVIAAASAVSLTTATPANLTSISLTAGDWDVWGNVTFVPAATTNVVQARGWISSTSATQPDASLYSGVQNAAAGIVPADNFGFFVPSQRISLASTTTIYISVTSAFSVDTLAVCGGIYARRRR